MLQVKNKHIDRMIVPFADLHSQYMLIKNEIDTGINKCISDASFINGNIVTKFENSFAKYIGTDFCIGCGNGTDALEIILASLGIGKDDEVLVPALSWIATAEAVNNVGAEPVFVDINPANFTIDTQKIEESIGPRTRAIIPVHLYGCPCDMGKISEIAAKHGLYIIEDCAQAHGAEIDGKKVGSFGIASAFSFFPSKNLGAFGDAGAILTNNPEIAETARKISNHGQLRTKHNHFIIGRNSRLDSIQATVLDIKLRYLDDWNKKRNVIANRYELLLKEHPNLILPFSESNKRHVFHLYVIRSDSRSALIKILDDNSISWGIHYPNPIPFLEAYRYKNHSITDYPVSGKITSEILSLPIYPEMNENQVDYICEKILDYYR
jgi:dTDP-4-amino-4,6-dideoxygalactose transaminase